MVPTDLPGCQSRPSHTATARSVFGLARPATNSGPLYEQAWCPSGGRSPSSRPGTGTGPANHHDPLLMSLTVAIRNCR
jgi:hypothetical protein